MLMSPLPDTFVIVATAAAAAHAAIFSASQQLHFSPCSAQCYTYLCESIWPPSLPLGPLLSSA